MGGDYLEPGFWPACSPTRPLSPQWSLAGAFFSDTVFGKERACGKWRVFLAGDPHGAEYPDHVPFDRDSNGGLEGQRLDCVRVYHAASFCAPSGDGAGVVPALQPDLFLDGNGLWKRGDHRSDLHDHGRKLGGASALYGRRCFAGVFFGDRCSPVSTSALLVSELTKRIYIPIFPPWVKTALAPFLISCVLTGS